MIYNLMPIFGFLTIKIDVNFANFDYKNFVKF